MSDVTRILNAIEWGDAKATDELLPLVYEERVLSAGLHEIVRADQYLRLQPVDFA